MMMMMIGLISDKIPFQRYARCAKRAQDFSDTWWYTRIRAISASDFGTTRLLVVHHASKFWSLGKIVVAD